MSRKFIKTSEFDQESCGLLPDDESGNCTGLTDNNSDPCDPFKQDEHPCTEFDISETGDESLIEEYVESSINIGGAKLNVHKLLGVKERGALIDTTQKGQPISSGDIPNFPAANAFSAYNNEWRSMQTGEDVIKHAYIGYDFGDIKLRNGRDQYGVDTFVKYDIARIKLQQGCNSGNRATKIRIERSSDGSKWFGVKIIDVEDCNGAITFEFNRSVPSRFWRIRPIQFNGGKDDYWSVRMLQLSDYEAVNINTIEDKIFLENRNRDYEEYGVQMKCSYTPIDTQTNISKWGFSNLFSRSEQYIIEVSFNQAIRQLGRPFVIGDVVQLPSETQYTPDLKPVYKYLEIKSVAWAVGGYTPTWKPTIQNLVAEPLMASQETQSIFGDLYQKVDDSGLANTSDGKGNAKYQDLQHISDTIRAKANDQVPQKGLSDEKIRKYDEDDAESVAQQLDNPAVKDLPIFNRKRGLFTRDAMPPNGQEYTEGETFPDNPNDGDYHRLTYSVEQQIPTRLFRFSGVKKDWIFMEKDERQLRDDNKSFLQEFLRPETSSRTPHDKIDDELDE